MYSHGSYLVSYLFEKCEYKHILRGMCPEAQGLDVHVYAHNPPQFDVHCNCVSVAAPNENKMLSYWVANIQP